MGLLDTYAAQADTAATNPLQALPRSAGERIEATAAETFAPDRYFTITGARRDWFQRSIDELHSATGETLQNPYGAVTSEEMMRLGNQPAVTQERSQKVIDAWRTADAMGHELRTNPENIDRYIGENATRIRERAASYEGTGNGFINFLAGAGISTIEPLNALTLAVPVTRLPTAAASVIGETFLRNVSREALLQAGVNVAAQGGTEALDYASRRETGTEQTAGEIAGNVAGAATFGALFGGGIRALHLKWLGLPETVRENAPTEVKDAFRIIEGDALYSGQNRLGVDPLLHERYQGRAMDSVLRGTPVDMADLARGADTPLTALGTILRNAPGEIGPNITGLGDTLSRVRALPDSELEAALRESRPQVFATLDDIGRRSAELDAKVAAIHEEVGQIGLPDIVDIDTGARLQDIETRLQAKGLRRVDRLDLERERDMITQSVDRTGTLSEELRKIRADFFPEHAKALKEIEEQRAALAREADSAKSVLKREVDQMRSRLDALQVGNRFADEVPADVLAREFGTATADLGAAIQRADVMRQARMVREVLPEQRRETPQGRPSERAETKPAEQAKALTTEVARILEPAPKETGRLVVARKTPDGEVIIGKPGQIHAELLTEAELKADTSLTGPFESQMGFATADGRFLTRQEALDYVKKAEPAALTQGNAKAKTYLEGAQYNEATKAIDEQRAARIKDMVVNIGGVDMPAARALEEADRMEKDAQVALGCAMGAL